MACFAAPKVSRQGWTWRIMALGHSLCGGGCGDLDVASVPGFGLIDGFGHPATKA